MIKVVKFGGSSVANAAQFEKVKNIVNAEEERKYIIVSACGKESFEDHKITDLLYLCDAHIRYNVSYEELFQQIEDKYRRIKEELNLSIDLEKEFAAIRNSIEKSASQDFIVSRGEYLTAKCLAEYIDAEFVDASEVIAFQYDGEVDYEKTKEQIEKIKTDKKVIIPGFYGALPNGIIKVFGRGGSDVTGSIVANVLDADVYENWTDVSGVYVADPRIIDNPLWIPRITYSESREMSYMGANVLHDDAVFPVRAKNIPINIRNTNEPDAIGTMIMEDCSEFDKENPPHVVTGIAGKKDFTVITLSKSHSSTEVGFLRKLLSVFEDYHISIEAVPITVDTFSVIVSSEAIQNNLYEIVGRLKNEFHPDEIRIDDRLSLIAVVGRRMKALPGISGKLLSEFGNNQINIKIINQSADELSIVVGVEDKDFEKAIKCIYDRFVLEEKESV